MKSLSKKAVLRILRKRQGSRPAAELATELGVSPQYLSDAFRSPLEIGPMLLAKLGLTRQTSYRIADYEKLRGKR